MATFEISLRLEFAGEWLTRRQKPLGGVGQRFPNPKNAAVIGRDQTVAAREIGRGAKPRCAGSRGQAGRT